MIRLTSILSKMSKSREVTRLSDRSQRGARLSDRSVGDLALCLDRASRGTETPIKTECLNVRRKDNMSLLKKDIAKEDQETTIPISAPRHIRRPDHFLECLYVHFPVDRLERCRVFF